MTKKTLREIYTEMADKYGSKTGEMVTTFSDKGAMHSYIEYYETHFSKKRDNVSLLEIGMMTGGSMHLWQNYFDKYDLVGMDLSPGWNQPRPFQAEVENDSNIKLLFGVNSTKDTPPNDVASRKFDFIIDDGDHRVLAQIETFKLYWPFLKDDGVYFIEDVVGHAQSQALKNFLSTYDTNIVISHYEGYLNNRADDQIIAVSKRSK